MPDYMYRMYLINACCNLRLPAGSQIFNKKSNSQLFILNRSVLKVSGFDAFIRQIHDLLFVMISFFILFTSLRQKNKKNINFYYQQLILCCNAHPGRRCL